MKYSGDRIYGSFSESGRHAGHSLYEATVLKVRVIHYCHENGVKKQEVAAS
jgi:hypothetical protein